jgi:nitrite reductase/ring-hydroxylating ferredoxin subunit
MTTRREFLRHAFATAVCGLLALSLPGCGGVQVLRTTSAAGRILVRREELDVFAAEGKAFAVDAPELEAPLLLFRGEDGAYRALSSECTHQKCRLNPSRSFLTCPCHGSVFDLDGNVVRGPAREPLRVFPVRAVDGGVEIDVSPREST